MKLVRNTTVDGSCKYALIRLDKLREATHFRNAERFLSGLIGNEDTVAKYIEIGAPGTEDEFFVLKLKDLNTAATLEYYASSIQDKDPEFAKDVFELAQRSRNLAYKEPD